MYYILFNFDTFWEYIYVILINKMRAPTRAHSTKHCVFSNICSFLRIVRLLPVPLNKLSEAFTAVNLDLERISKWSCKFGLHVNPTKSQNIVIDMFPRVHW